MYISVCNKGELDRVRQVKEQEALVRGGTKHTHCVYDVVVVAFISRRAVAPLALILLLVFANV